MNNMAELVLTGTEQKLKDMKAHLEKEHPSTRGKLKIVGNKLLNISKKVGGAINTDMKKANISWDFEKYQKEDYRIF